MSDSSTTDPARQCVMPTCTHEAVEPGRSGSLCSEHLDTLDRGNEQGAERPESVAVEPDESPTVEGDAAQGGREHPVNGEEHENPVDVSDVSDAERARMLLDYTERWVDEFGSVPRMLPLDAKGKGPEASGWYSVADGTTLGTDANDVEIVEKAPTQAALERSVGAYEAARQIEQEGARGFALYAGVPEFGTEGVVFVDHDEPDFSGPTGEPTLRVLSGSGRSYGHETYRNDPDDPVANARVGDNLGEIRADYWYVVIPGSAHPTGGVYHVVEDQKIATLSDADLSDEMRPASATRSVHRENNPALADLDGTGDAPEDDEVKARLDAAFSNPRDGDRVEDVYNGNYAAAGFSDRSAAEYWLANRLDAYVGLGRSSVVEQVMDRANLQKWPDRMDRAYRKSVLGGVGTQEWYFDPDGGDEPGAAEGEQVATVPFGRLAELNDDAARQYAREWGVEWPSTRAARSRLRNRLITAFRASESVVLDAPTGLGKSHTAATEPWLRHTDTTGDAPVVHFAPTCDARDENIRASREAGVSHAALKGRKDRCPVARGDHDPSDRDDRNGEDPEIVLTVDGMPASEWMDEQCDRKGNPFQLAHSWLDAANDQGADLPCTADGRECPAMTQWEGVPRDDDGNPAVDVVHATHPFLYVPGLRQHVNVVLDETPNAFTVDFGQDRIRKAVNAYLDAVNAPVKSFEALVTLAETTARAGDIGAERDALEATLGTTPDREWYVKHPDAHALAPDLTRAIYRAIRWEDPDANGRRSTQVIHEPPRFDSDSEGFGGNFLTVVLDDRYTIQSVRHTPDLSGARSVVGLDAHPCMPLWERNVGPQVVRDDLLEPTERRLWRRFERGLTVVQVGDATRPRSGEDAGEWDAKDSKLSVLMQALRARYGDDFRTGVCPRRTERRFRTRLADAGVPKDDIATMHYGEETSRNDFAGEPVGLVNGCIDPGDDYVIDLLAECDLDALPARVDPADLDDPTKALCAACGGRTCSECGHTGLQRTKGRGFDGPDADAAAAILASVRETHVAQAAGRYARNADDPDDTAIVYVRTDAIPDSFADAKVPGVEWVATDTQREIITLLADRSQPATVKGLADESDTGRSHTRKTLKRLVDQEVVERSRGGGPNPDRYALLVEPADASVHVDFLERGKSASGLNGADTDGKARTPTYRNLVCDCPSFSAENEGLSGPEKIDVLLADSDEQDPPGPLALATEEIREQLPAAGDLDPPR